MHDFAFAALGGIFWIPLAAAVTALVCKRIWAVTPAQQAAGSQTVANAAATIQADATDFVSQAKSGLDKFAAVAGSLTPSTAALVWQELVAGKLPPLNPGTNAATAATQQ